jgi:hypothetical protein
MILLAVGWYLRFSLSNRDVEELLAERGLHYLFHPLPCLQSLQHIHLQSVRPELLDVEWVVMVPAREATVGPPLRRQVFSPIGLTIF